MQNKKNRNPDIYNSGNQARLKELAEKYGGVKMVTNKPKNILTIHLNIYDPTMLKYEAEVWAKQNGYKYDSDAHLFADFILTVDEDNITTGYSFHDSPELNEAD